MLIWAFGNENIVQFLLLHDLDWIKNIIFSIARFKKVSTDKIKKLTIKINLNIIDLMQLEEISNIYNLKISRSV